MAIYVTKKARTDFETRIANNVKENPNELYSYVNNKTIVRSEITVLTNRDRELAILPHQKADILNTFLPAYILKKIQLTLLNQNKGVAIKIEYNHSNRANGQG